MLRFENYCEDVIPLDEDGMPPHGYGVRTVRATAQKYGGTVTVHCEDDWFILRVLLPGGRSPPRPGRPRNPPAGRAPADESLSALVHKFAAVRAPARTVFFVLSDFKCATCTNTIGS